MSNRSIFHFNSFAATKFSANEKRLAVLILRIFRSSNDPVNEISSSYVDYKEFPENLRQLVINLSQKKINAELSDIYHNHLENGVEIITLLDSNYPLSLLELNDPPFCIFVKHGYGNSFQDINWSQDNKLSVVGSRHATCDAIQLTESLCQKSSQNNICVVSGLAMGVDAAAHRGALAGKTSKDPKAPTTIAVLAHDVTQCFPSSSQDLYENILNNNGIVISEYPLEIAAMKHHFIARNRIIAALSKCTVVAQAKEKSGALITAKYALDLGKEVATLPWSLTVRQAKGSNSLLRAGAYPILSVKDLLSLYELPLNGQTREKEENLENSQVEKNVLLFLKNNGSAHISIIKKKFPVSDNQLLDMQLKDKIVSNSVQMFSISSLYREE